MNTAHTHSSLLAALPRGERERIERAAETVSLSQGQWLAARGDEIARVYFPLDATIALLAEDENNDVLAVALIGAEGMLGASIALDGRTWPLRAAVQGEGSALRLEADVLRRILAESPLLERALRRYLRACLAQFAQVAVCGAYHMVVQRVAYWLLLTHDRAPGDRFYLTHELLAHLLGVRRSGVTAAAGVLQRRNLIAYTRGRVVVLDRRGLEHAACGCYRVAHAALETARPSAADLAAAQRANDAPQTASIHEARLGTLRKIMGGRA